MCTSALLYVEQAAKSLFPDCEMFIFQSQLSLLALHMYDDLAIVQQLIG